MNSPSTQFRTALFLGSNEYLMLEDYACCKGQICFDDDHFVFGPLPTFAVAFAFCIS